MKLGVLAAASVLLLLPSVAHAQGAKPSKPPSGAAAPGATKYRSELPALTLASDDAEDQAEALSGAMRSRIRALPGVTLDDTTTQNLSTFTTALGCNSKPDPLCLIKIGDQLKVERFLWGTVHKGPDKGHVTAEVHLWRRGKPDSVATESFAENLRDQNDDVLRRIAGRLVDKLLGQPVAASVTIRAGNAAGDVVVDGGERIPLVRGETTVELKPGRHTLMIRAKGYKPQQQDVDVVSTAEQVLALKLEPEDGVEPFKPSKPISVRTIIALGFIGVGVGFGVAGTVKAAQFLSIKSDNQRDHDTLVANNFCDRQNGESDPALLAPACNRLNEGRDALKMELIFYGIAAVTAGTGIVLLITDTPDKEGQSASKFFPKITPRIGKSSGGVDLSLRF